MFRFLKNGVKRFIALLMVLSIILSTNSFDALSKVYAEGSIATGSSFVKNAKEQISEDEIENDESDESATESETDEKSDANKNNFCDGMDTATNSEADDSVYADEKGEPLGDKNNDDESATKSEIKTNDHLEMNYTNDNTSTESEIDEANENEIIITASDCEINLATENEIKTPYKELDTYSQINFYDKDTASLDGDIIKLEKDIELKDTLYFKDGMNLDLAGHNIYAPNDNYAIYIEKNFTLYNTTETVGKIEGKGNKYPTIYLNSATATFAGGKIYGAKGLGDGDSKNLNGGDAIHSYNSNITFGGALVYGGNGEDNSKGQGGNGGDALVVLESNKSNKIIVENGVLKGGDGGAGLGEDEPEKGAALKVNNKVYESIYFGQGLPGNVGGGSGGVAIDIRTEKFLSKNLSYKDYTLNAGHAGYSKKIDINEEAIKNKVKLSDDDEFGASPLDSFYSLHDLEGKNYLTSLKNQGSTGLCTAFSTVAYAESYLIRNYPEFVKDTLGKNVDDTLDIAKWDSNANELNLSEIYFGMQMFTQPKDEFGNAGLSRFLSDISNESNWAHYGSDTRILSINPTTWRAFIEEEPASAFTWPSDEADVTVTSPINRNLLNNYTNKTIVHANSNTVRDAGEFYNGTVFDRDAFILQLKNDIINHTGVVLGIYTGDRQDIAKINDSTYKYSKNGVSYGNYLASLNMTEELSSSIDLGGHAMYCIGWDDDVTYTDTLGLHKGAFICKNSWSMFTFVPYDNAWGFYYGADANDGNTHAPNKFMDYIAIEFTPSFSRYENNYFYDSGIGTHYIDQVGGASKYDLDYSSSAYGTIRYGVRVYYKSIFSTYEVKHDKEKVKAISFQATQPGDYEVSLYRVSSLTDESQLENDMVAANRLTSENCSVKRGVNTIDVPEVDLSKGDLVAVKVTRTDKNDYGDVSIDSIIDQTHETKNPDGSTTWRGTRYETVEQGKSFFVDPYIKVKEITQAGNVYTESDAMFSTLYSLNGGGASAENYIKSLPGVFVAKFPRKVNARIRLYTNNYIKLDANGKGKYANNENVTYTYPMLRSAIGAIEEPTPNSAADTFTKYNTKPDGSGEDYTTSSIYNMDIAKSLTLYAQYTTGATNATLSFNAGSGSGTMSSMTRPIGTPINVPSATFTKTGYDFDCWTDGTNDINVGSPVVLNTDITLTAKWKEKEYDINYVENGGSFIAGSSYATKRKYTEDKSLPTSANIAKTGYEFAGWYDNDKFTGSVITSTNAANTEMVPTYYAKWNPITYTIEYVTNGGVVTPTSFTKTYGINAVNLATPVREKDRFDGWYTDNTYTTVYNKGDLSTIKNDTKYIYAKWTNVYTVSFDMKGHGKQVESQDIIDGGKVKEPTNVVAANYKFEGWFTDDTYATKWDFATDIVLDSKTLVAKWTYVPTIVFKFVTDHGREPEPQYIFNNTKVIEPDKISVLGYKFFYWYETDEKVPFDFSKVIEVSTEGERTLYAKWEAITYKVTLNAGNGEIISGDITSYTYGVGAKLPMSVVPKNKGQVFAGWYDNKEFKGDTYTEIKPIETGDKEFFAKYNNSSGSNPGGSGGSSTSGRSSGTVNPAAVTPTTNTAVNPLAANAASANENRETKISVTMRSVPINYNTSDSIWENDSNGDRHLNVKNEFGQYVEAKNMFACVVTVHKDAEGKSFDIQDFYYFDNDGKMYTGWLKDPNNITYYFDATPGSEIGKLSRGWTKISGDYYYFDGSGALQTNTVTPDGYNVDASGKWASGNTEKK